MWRRVLFLMLASIAGPAAGQGIPETRDSLLVSPEWLEAHLGDSALVVLQVERDGTGYLAGHISGARLVLLHEIVVTRDDLPAELPPLSQLDSVLEASGVSNGSRIVLYGDPLATSRLFFTLDYLGMAGHVALLDGGLSAWTLAGRSLSQSMPEPRGGHLEPHVQPELLVDAAWISSRLSDTSVVLLDARTPAEYDGQVAGDGVARAGHIPGAGTAYWRMMLTNSEPVRLKAAPTLRALLGRAGLAPGREVVTYCRIGVQASVLYFVARYLGYAPRLYDGSFVDWSRNPDLPVARP